MFVKVIQVTDGSIKFDDGSELYSNHNQDCCENHYLDFEHLSIDDFEGLVFDISSDHFFGRIEGYGIELIPIKGHSVKIPGYANNNGFYSSNMQLILTKNDKDRLWDISECQDY